MILLQIKIGIFFKLFYEIRQYRENIFLKFILHCTLIVKLVQILSEMLFSTLKSLIDNKMKLFYSDIAKESTKSVSGWFINQTLILNADT